MSAALLGLGTDVADTCRFRRLMERSGPRFWEHWFTPTEADQCRRNARPEYAAAVRFAIKEAAVKALGVALDEASRWREIEVLRDGSNYDVRFHAELAALAACNGPYRVHVSTSRCGTYAFATVVIESWS